ncbi:uncharacterized protein FYW47_013983 [Aplochiton taeniatus]
MDRYRYFIFNQRSVVVLGILQVACACLCVVCGFMDAAFRKDTALSKTRAPVWTGVVNIMILSAGFSWVAALIVAAYAGLTLSYGEDDNEVFHHHHTPEVTFVLGRLVKGTNATILLSCSVSLLLSSFIAFVGCRSLPLCGCYDQFTGLETLVPQADPYPQTEMVCTWQADLPEGELK